MQRLIERHLMSEAAAPDAGGTPADPDPGTGAPDPEKPDNPDPKPAADDPSAKTPTDTSKDDPDPGKQPAANGKDTALDKGGKTPDPDAGKDDQQRFLDTLPENWRQRIVEEQGLEEKHLNVLNRYPSFDKFVNAFFEQRDTIAKGQHKAGLPEDPTEEQLAEYRQANGIPEKPEGYAEVLDEGLVLSDEDKRIMEPIFGALHQHNVPANAAKDAINAWFNAREREMESELQQHGIDQQQATKQLRETWGSDFETNRNLVRSLFATLPEEVRESVMQAQMADGRMLFNSPEFLFWAADLKRQLDPMATVVPNSTSGLRDMKTEIEKIEQTMRDDPDKYWKDQGMQKRYEELLEAKQKLEEQGRWTD